MPERSKPPMSNELSPLFKASRQTRRCSGFAIMFVAWKSRRRLSFRKEGHCTSSEHRQGIFGSGQHYRYGLAPAQKNFPPFPKILSTKRPFAQIDGKEPEHGSMNMANQSDETLMA